jgi:hypothetical protein
MVQKHRSLMRVALSVVVTVLLGGCPAHPPRPETADEPSLVPPPGAPSSTPATPGQPPVRTPQPPRENRLSPATRSLVNQARSQLSHGDADGASSTLDRALRIEPNNPLLWTERGRLRLGDNDAHQAEVCARKALALASGDKLAQRQAGLVLIDSLKAQGRNQEAHEVESQPFMRP